MAEPHFRLGAIGYGKSLYTHPKVNAVVEKAHSALDNTRGPLSIRQNVSVYDGVLHVRRLTASPDVEATYEPNPNAKPSSVVPTWAKQAVGHLASLRTVTTVGMLDVGRGSDA